MSKLMKQYQELKKVACPKDDGHATDRIVNKLFMNN